MQRRRTFFAAFALAAAILTSASSFAQESRSTLSGTITDPAGLVVAGAQVTLTNTQTSVALETRTNEVGQYRFLFINPGTYRLTAQSPGFRSFGR